MDALSVWVYFAIMTGALFLIPYLSQRCNRRGMVAKAGAAHLVNDGSAGMLMGIYIQMLP